MIKKYAKRSLSVLLVVVMLLGFVPGLGELAQEAVAAGNVGNAFEGQDADLFSALGFDTSQLPEGYDADTTDNPYGRDKMPGSQVFEVLLAQADRYQLQGNGNNNLDYSSISNGASVTRSMPAGVELFAAAVGDFTGDGLVGQVAYVGVKDVESHKGQNTKAELCLFVFDAVSGTYSGSIKLGSITPYTTINGDMSNAPGQTKYEDRWQNLLQISCGDYDGDGISEIAVYVAESGNPRVEVYKYQRTSQSGANDWLSMDNWGRVWSHAVAVTGPSLTPNMVSLVSGDLNRDGVDDLGIAVGHATYKFPTMPILGVPSFIEILISASASNATVLWGGKSNMLQKPTTLDLGQKHEKLGELARVSLTMGDVNGDGTPELVMTGQPLSDLSSNTLRSVATYVYDSSTGLTIDTAETLAIVDGSYVTAGEGENASTEFSSNNGYDANYKSKPIMRTNSAVVRPEGSEYTYVYVDSVLVKYYEGSLSIGYELDDPKYDTENGELPGGWGDNKLGYGYSEYGAVSGDINGEGFHTFATQFLGGGYVGAFASATYRHAFATLGVSGGALSAQVSSVSDAVTYITMPDTDYDTTLIEYSGIHYLTYSDPQVLAIIAAAPYFEDVDIISDYDYAWQNATSYSRINGSGHSSIVAVDFSIGGYASAEIEGGGGKGEIETSIGFTLNWEKETTKSYEYTLSFETSQDEDAVAFYSIPTENYVYNVYTPNGNGTYTKETKVISNTFSPAYQVLSLDYYESIQGNYEELPQIAGVALTSTPGDPASYPSSTSGYKTIAAWNDDPAGVSFGNGAITQEITITEEESETYQLGGYWNFKAGGGVGIQSDIGQVEVDITGGVEWSLNPSGGWANIDMEGTSISGTVTNMPKEFQDYGYYYSWKLFSYAYKFSNGSQVPVVSYVVNDVSAPPSLPRDFHQDFEKSTTDSNYLTWTYDGSVSTFHLYKYNDFPVGGGLQKIETISAGDAAHYQIKHDSDGKPYKEYFFIDEGLTPYTEYQYAIQVERLSPVPPLSAPSGLLSVRTKAENGYPKLSVSESDNNDDGVLLVYPDKNSYLTVQVTGPDGESISNYYTTVQYQWQKMGKSGWTDLVNETNKTLTFAAAGVDTAGLYRCLVNVQTKAEGTYISAFTDTITLTHSKRTSYISELNVKDVSGGGVELYAAVANAHGDSATVPSGTVTFTLTSNQTGDEYQYFVALDATGVANQIIESQLPEGMYTVHAYYSGSYIFKASSADGVYLSQIGSGYAIDSPTVVTYGNGAVVSFQKISKVSGVTSTANEDADTYALLAGDTLTAGKLYTAYALPGNNSVVAGRSYYFVDSDGVPYSFTASRSGTVTISGDYALYESVVVNGYLTKAEGAGKYSLAANTPVGGYVVKMTAVNTGDTSYSALYVNPKTVVLQLPNIKAGEDVDKTTSIDYPIIGDLTLVSGGWASCDMTDGVLNSGIADTEVSTVKYTNTGGKRFSSTTVNDFCGYYTLSNNLTTTLVPNYSIMFLDGSVTILGATNDLYIGAREFEELPVGTIYTASPDFGYTREAITGSAGSYSSELMQKHQTGTRVVFTAVPDAGYEIYDWYINGVAQGVKSNSLVHIMLRETTRVEVQFDVQKNKLSFGTAGDKGGGTIVCSDPDLTSGSVLLANSLFTFTATANEGYHFKEWRYTQVGSGTVYDNGDDGKMSSTFDFIMPEVSCSVYAVFERDYYTLTYTDTSGNDGLTAWYLGSASSDASAELERIAIPSGTAVKGDTLVVIEPAVGSILDSRYSYVSIGSQGIANYLLDTYTLTLTEDTTVKCATVRQKYDVSFAFDVTGTTSQPVDAEIVYTINGEEGTFGYVSGAQSMTKNEIPGGSPVSAQVIYPDYYDLLGWTYSGTSYLTASADKDNLATVLTQADGSAVVKGRSYYYEVVESGSNKAYYFVATETGTAAWSGTDVTITAAGDSYSVAKLGTDSVFTVHLKEKPTHTITLETIDKGEYSYTLPDGAFEETKGIITLHEGDDFTVSVIPKQKFTVSYWEVTPASGSVPYRYRAKTLSHAFPAIAESYTFEPIFSSTSYNTISWPGISEEACGITLSSESGYLSSVASGKDFKFKLSGSGHNMLDKVYANGHEFTKAGNIVGDTSYSYSASTGVYTIANITENQVISLTMNEIGVTVNGVDISELSGAGWSYDTKNQVLKITRSGLTISGDNETNGFAPELSIQLGDSVGSVVFKDLNIASYADVTVSSTRSEGVTITASGISNVLNISDGINLSALRAAGGMTVRGNGQLNVDVTPSSADTPVVRVIEVGIWSEFTVTGNVNLSVSAECDGQIISGTFAGVRASIINVGASGAAVEPTMRVSIKNSVAGLQTNEAFGLTAETLNTYGGSLLVYAEGYGADVSVIETYGGIVEISGSKKAFSEFSTDSLITSNVWRVHYAEGYQLRTKESFPPNSEYMYGILAAAYYNYSAYGYHEFELGDGLQPLQGASYARVAPIENPAVDTITLTVTDSDSNSWTGEISATPITEKYYHLGTNGELVSFPMGHEFIPNNLQEVLDAVYVAREDTHETNLAAYVYKQKDGTTGDTISDYELVASDKKYDYTLKGTYSGAAMYGGYINATSENIKTLTLDGFIYSRMTVSDAPIYLVGENSLIARMSTPLTAEDGKLNLYSEDGTGSLTLITAHYATDQTVLQNGDASNPLDISLHNVKALTLFAQGDDSSSVVGSDYTVKYYDDILSKTEGEYGYAWLQDYSETAAAQATTSAAFDGVNTISGKYLKLYSSSADAEANPAQLGYDKATTAVQLLEATLYMPAENGKIHLFNPDDAGSNSKVSLLGSGGQVIKDWTLNSEYSWSSSGNKLTLDKDTVSALDNGSYTLRVSFYDDDTSDSTFYNLDIPLVVKDSAASSGALTISPSSVTTRRGETIVFETEYTGTTPKIYVWEVDDTSNFTLTGNGSTATLKVKDSAPLDAQYKVTVRSYPIAIPAGAPLGVANANITVVPSATKIAISCPTETPSGDGNYILYHNTVDGSKKSWDFDAAVTLDNGTLTSDDVRWELWGATLRTTLVHPDTGVLTIDPNEVGVSGMLRLTAIYTQKDGTEATETVDIRLSTDSRVSYTALGVNGQISTVVYGASQVSVPEGGAWIPAGNKVIATATPSDEFVVNNWYVNGISVMNNPDYTVDAENHTLSFTTEKMSHYKITADYINENSFTVTFVEEGRGTVSAKLGGKDFQSGSMVVKGGTVAITAVPESNCRLKHWYVNDEIYTVNDTPYTGEILVLSDITEAKTVKAVFEGVSIDLKFVAGINIPGDTETNGSLTAYVNGQPLTAGEATEADYSVTYSAEVKAMDQIVIFASPDSGYQVKAWYLWDGSKYHEIVGTAEKASYSVDSITAALQVKAVFEPITAHALTVVLSSFENGAGRVLFGTEEVVMDPGLKTFTVYRHDAATLVAVPELGSYLYEWEVTGAQYTTDGDALTLLDVTGDVRVKAVMRKNYFTVSLSGEGAGSITAHYDSKNVDNISGDILYGKSAEVKGGSEVVFTIMPDTDNIISSLTINGDAVTPQYDSTLGVFTVTIDSLIDDIEMEAEFTPVIRHIVTAPQDYSIQTAGESTPETDDDTFETTGTVIPGFVADGASRDVDNTDRIVEIAEGGAATIMFKPETGYTVNIQTLMTELEAVLSAAGSEAEYSISISGSASGNGYMATISGVDMELDFSAMASPFEASAKTLYEITFAKDGNGKLIVYYENAQLLSGAKVPDGAELQIVAVPDEHYELTELEANTAPVATQPDPDDENTITASHVVIEATDFSAKFELCEQKVIVNVIGTGGGEVSLNSSSGITSSTTEYLRKDSTVSIEATPESGSKLTNLVVGGVLASGTTHTVSSLDSDLVITAAFEALQSAVTFNSPENGTLTVYKSDGSKVQLGEVLPVGTTLIVITSPDAHYKLESLTAGGAALDGNSYIVNAGRVNSITATFSVFEVPVSWQTPEGGTLSVTKKDGSPVASGQYVPVGTELRIRAVADSSFELESLLLNKVTIVNSSVYTINEATEIAANFNYTGYTPPKEEGPGGDTIIINNGGSTTVINGLDSDSDYTLSVVIIGNGSVKVTAEGEELESGSIVKIGTILTIKASSTGGTNLQGLTVNGVEFKNGAEYEVYANTEVRAVFDELLPYYLNSYGKKVFIGFSYEANQDGIWDEQEYIAPSNVEVQFAPNRMQFIDTEGHWGEEYIDFVTGRELFVGTSATEFSPNQNISRAMFATVIGRLYERSYGEITASAEHAFRDCNYTMYYGKYVDWAEANGILRGYGNGNFGPEDPITREQMAVILYNFADFLGALPTTIDSTLTFKDADKISGWAQSAALFCQTTEIIKGMGDGVFAPASTATRAETATVIVNLIKYMFA